MRALIESLLPAALLHPAFYTFRNEILNFLKHFSDFSPMCKLNVGGRHTITYISESFWVRTRNVAVIQAENLQKLLQRFTTYKLKFSTGEYIKYI